MPSIRHRDGCDRPTGPTGTEAACDCAMYQGQFPPPDGYDGPVPTEREWELARSQCGCDACGGITWDVCEEGHRDAHLLARHREELLAPIREALAAHDGNAPPSAYETLRRIREVIGG